MEPCAPGTEDDLPITYSTLNKRENEQERLLSQKAILRNGKYDNVFELSFLNGAEHWFCKACECPVMGRVYQHEIGKRHTQNLQNTNRFKDRQPKEEERHEELVIDVAPGEPVPPGFEGEIERTTQIQERLDGFKVGPLVALEYLLELQDYDTSKEPVYLCILCDKRGDPRTVLTHLASYNHISQYLQRHFPTCWRSLAPYMTKQYKRNWQASLHKIAEGIEKKFGRLKPYPIDKDKFEKERMLYLMKISKGKHFSEQSGYTFEELVVHDELTKVHEDEKSHETSTSNNWGEIHFIQKPFKKKSPSPPVVAKPVKKVKVANLQGTVDKSPQKQQLTTTSTGASTNADLPSKRGTIRRRSLSSVSSVSSSELSDIGRRDKSKMTKSKSPIFHRGRNQFFNRRRSPSPRRRSPSPRRMRKEDRGSPRRRLDPLSEVKKITEQEKEKLRKIEEFRKLARAIENDMHKTLKQHEKNPEKHPQYNEEWKKFWNRRYKELQAAGTDASKHDFKPEWIEFWNKRMIEIHSDELRNRKEALRKRLALPEEMNPIKFNIMKVSSVSKTSPKPNLPMAALPDQDNEVIIIDDKDDEKKSLNRSNSPWEQDKPSTERKSPARRWSPGRKRSPTRKRSPLRKGQDVDYRYDRYQQRSVEKHLSGRTRERSRSRDISRSRNLSREISPRRLSHLKDFSKKKDISISRDRSDSKGRDVYSKEKRSRSRELSRDRKRDYRESSFERDMKARERVRTVADLPWEREKAYRSHYDFFYDPPPIMRDVTRQPVPEQQMMMPMPIMEEDDDDGEINVVDVLRILTAVEDKLGSLGPKIIDLLAQALAMEKKEANSSETLLDNDINCVLFETVKEKLKGQLLAGLVDLIQERAFKKAIKKIAGLIHLTSQRKRQREKLLPTAANPVTVPGVGNVDKAAIAKQIANALILQGKTDVTQAELEQLINAVVGMAEASKNTNKPMTTAAFLEKLSQGEIEKKIEPTEKIIVPSSSKKNDIGNIQKLTEPLTPSPGKNSVSNMENLSDSDLQTLLQNFKDLSTDEQHNLINYLKKLEFQEPQRVEKLRQFVNLEPNVLTNEEKPDHERKEKTSGRESPFSNRLGGVNPASDDLVKIESDEEEMDNINNVHNEDATVKEEKVTEGEKSTRKINVDSEDEDYTFEDVVKTVSKNVKDKELETNMKIVEETMKFENSKAKSDIDLNNAKDLISNLMSNITKTSNSNNIDLLGLGRSTTVSNSPSMLSNSDFVKTLSNINVSNLTNIVNSVKKMGNSGEKYDLQHSMDFQKPNFDVQKQNPTSLIFDPSQLNKPHSPNRNLKLGNNIPFSEMRRVSDHFEARGGPMIGPGGPSRGFVGPSFGRDRGHSFDHDRNSSFDQDRGSSLSTNVSLRGQMNMANLARGHAGGTGYGPRSQPLRNSAPYGNNVSNQQMQFLRGPRPNFMDQRNNPSFNNFNSRW